MKRIIYIILLLCTVFTFESMAQTAKSAYFLDGTYHNFKLNPAMKAERGFFSLGLGNMTIGANSNIGISDFLYPTDDNRLTTFMSGSVDQKEFLNRLPKSIRFGMNFDETLMAFGFRMFGGYTSFSLSLHSNTSIALPKGFFEFAKKGLQESSYNFSGINMRTMNYTAATLGYSHEVYRGLRVGVNLKYLMGLAYADATFDNFNIEMSEERWKIEAHAQAQAALGTQVYFANGENALEDLQFGPFAPAATGFAVDLGAVYDVKEFVPGLTVSASLIDLGKINWQYMMSMENNGTPIEWNGLTDATLNDISNSIGEELERLGEDAEQMMEFEIHDIQKGATKLGATMYLGAEYNMPFYKPLSVAMLYGKKFSTYNGWDEFRGYVNIAPLKWLEASANMGFTTYGTSWGWMFNFHPGWTSFFIGSDYMISKVTPQFIPVNDLNYHITFGINMPLGKRISPNDDNRKARSTKSERSVQTIIITEEIILPVLNVTLNESEVITTVGDTIQLIATVTPDNATNKAVTWSCSNDSVAIVDNGTVIAVGNGTAVITATADDQTATCEITVDVKTTEESVEKTSEEVSKEATEGTSVEPTEETQVNATEEISEEVLNESEETVTTEGDTTDSSRQ